MPVRRTLGRVLKKFSQRRKAMKRAGFFAGMTVALLAVFGAQPSQAMRVAPNPLPSDAAALATEVQGNQQFRRNNQNANRGGGNRQNANRNNNNRQNANRNNNNRQNANRNNNNRQNANRNNNNNRNNANRNRQNSRNFNNNRNRNVNVNVRVNTRPVRGWTRRPYFGTVVAGVTLGTIIAASAVPIAPASNLCWYWTDPSFTRGYWDYCF
jgi:hypothetical protein